MAPGTPRWATERKLIDGEWEEMPILRITPRDLVLLIDRLQILFGRPATISEGHGFAATITTRRAPQGAAERPITSTAPEVSVGSASGQRRLKSLTADPIDR